MLHLSRAVIDWLHTSHTDALTKEASLLKGHDMKVSKEQIQILTDHIQENPDQTPNEVANYIARITDMGEDDTLALATIVMYLKNGDPIPAVYLEETRDD